MALFRKRRRESFEDPILGKEESAQLNVSEARPQEGFVDPIIAREDFEVPVFQEEEDPPQP